jgi:hypothetical protein
MQTVMALCAKGSRPPPFAIQGTGGWGGTTVDAHHLTMTHPEILAVIGPILEDHLAGRTKLGSIQPNGGGKSLIPGYLGRTQRNPGR